MVSVEEHVAMRAGHFGPFNDLYTAVYAIIDDAKATRKLVKLYKGSHLSSDPHEHVLKFASFFAEHRCGPLGYASQTINPDGPARVEDLDTFDAEYRPRLPMRAVFDELKPAMRRPSETPAALLDYLTSRRHHLGGYRGGSSGFDDEARATAALHFRRTGIRSTPGEVLVFSGGAKGVFLAFCAAVMSRRRFDELHHVGGALLAPEGYYQSLRLIPAVFGGEIQVVPNLTAGVVGHWLNRTAERPHRALYVPLVNNATGQVLTADRANALAVVIRIHNAINRHNPVFVLGDDVYAESYLDEQPTPMPIGAAPGMRGCTVSVTSPSKTFALPTARVAFATTSNSQLAIALAHYRTVFSHGRVPQVSELTAAAALALTPEDWITGWNDRYRERLNQLDAALERINTDVGFRALTMRRPEGGWYVPLAIARAVFPIPIASSVEAFAILLHYGGSEPDSGLGTLPGELFGHRLHPSSPSVTVRATLALPDADFQRFTTRLSAAVNALIGPAGPRLAELALQRAREVADLDTIVARLRY